jgi:hypothetical protein
LYPERTKPPQVWKTVSSQVKYDSPILRAMKGKFNMNIVSVRHLSDFSHRSLLFSVPDGIMLKFGDRVRVHTVKGDADAVCNCDSFEADEATVKRLAELEVVKYYLPLKEVFAVYKLEEFAKPEPKAEIKEPARYLAVKNYGSGTLIKQGEIYAQNEYGHIRYSNGKLSVFTAKELIESALKGILFPLVKRPARVGEWVRVIEANGGKVLGGTIWQVEDIAKYDERSPLVFRDGWMCKGDNYEVIDGYNGEYHA